jgi:hypothetical protein
MIHEFKNLTEEESNLMLMTPALVTLLIAGAEGNIDEKEIDWGTKITHFRANEHSIIQNYYLETDKNFNETLQKLIEVMPKDVKKRSDRINGELKKLNRIFSKLDPQFSKVFYNSLLSLSKHVAKASGGLWGFGSISPEEKKYLDLHVIDPPGN